MRRAARSCRNATSNMGPCGPVPSLLHRHLPATPRRPHRRVGRPVDRPAPGRAGPPPWNARRRAAGAGPHHRLALCDRVLVTLVVLRLQLPHQALATLFGVDRATITRAVGEVRPLPAARGFAVPGQPGVRLRTLANVFAYAQASGVELHLDGCDRCEDSSRTAAPRSSSRARLRPERLAWLLRTGGRGADRAAADRRVRRPRLGDLIPSWRARLEHAMGCPGATAPLHVPQSSNTSGTASGRAWRRHGGLAAWAVVEGVGASVSRCACWMSWPSRSTAFW
jgi:Helix-turn-helix of DDE superfamily endonuclease